VIDQLKGQQRSHLWMVQQNQQERPPTASLGQLRV